MGKFHVQLCTTTPCMLGGVGSDVILEAIEEHLSKFILKGMLFMRYSSSLKFNQFITQI